MTVKLNPNYRSDIAVVFNAPELTAEQLKRFAAIGFSLANTKLGTDLVVWKNIALFSNTAYGDDAVGFEKARPAFDGQVQSDYVFDTVDGLLNAITVPVQVEPVITNEHIRVLDQLGYSNAEAMSCKEFGEVAFLLTNNGGGNGECVYTIGAPSGMIIAKAAQGEGTIYKSMDELIDDLVLLHTTA